MNVKFLVILIIFGALLIAGSGVFWWQSYSQSDGVQVLAESCRHLVPTQTGDGFEHVITQERHSFYDTEGDLCCIETKYEGEKGGTKLCYLSEDENDFTGIVQTYSESEQSYVTVREKKDTGEEICTRRFSVEDGSFEGEHCIPR